MLPGIEHTSEKHKLRGFYSPPPPVPSHKAYHHMLGWWAMKGRTTKQRKGQKFRCSK